MGREQEVALAVVFVFSLLGLYFYLSQPEYDHGPTRWARWKAAIAARYITSSDVSAADNSPIPPKESVSAAVSASESGVSAVSDLRFAAEIDAKVADALARLIEAGELDKTPAIKIGLGGKSGDAYQKKKALLDAALERAQPRTPIADRPTKASFQDTL